MSRLTRIAGVTIMGMAALAVVASGGAAQHLAEVRQEWPVWEMPSPLTTTTALDEEDSPSERAFAGIASALLPGAGQFYRGERLKGAVMLSAAAASVVYALTAGIGEAEVCAGAAGQQVCQTAPHQINSRFWIGLGSAAGVQVWSILDALSEP